MKSDREFYLLEFKRCLDRYQRTPLEESRQRKFLRLMSESMLSAYIEARSKEAERSEKWT